MSYQESIAAALNRVLTGPLGIAADSLEDLTRYVETPKDIKMGDFAFPCFRLARVLRKKPVVIANEILPHMQQEVENSEALTEVSSAGPYLNFRINRAAQAGSLISDILEGTFLAPRPATGERVMIEYSQPNTHKAFHVGHTRNVALGDALIHIFEWQGNEVVAANYIGDEGAHIAKCLWYYKNHFDGNLPESNLGEFLGDLYTRATVLLDFKLLTKCPMPGVIVARVTSIEDHPNPKLKTVGIDKGSETVQVVCGGTGYAVGDLVAYANLGTRVRGRLVDTVEKDGVTSTGMILSCLELGFGDDKDAIYIIGADGEPGIEVAEFFRVEGALDKSVSVLDVMAQRNQGVADTLHKLEARDPELTALWEKTKKWSMDEFYTIYQWLHARFDRYFFESEVGGDGKTKVLDHFEKGLLVKSEGAIGADLSEYGMPFFLLLKSNGAGLYSTKDIALAQDKFDKYGIDRSVYVVDVSQSLHFQQVFKTLELMGYEKAKNCHHLAYGMVVLAGPNGPVKMSSRDGNVILLSELKTRLIERVTSLYLERFRGEWPDQEIAEAADCIAVATIKYGMNNQDNAKRIVFDLNEWTEQSGNNGPYNLYAYARTRNILRKVGDYDKSLTDWSLLNHDKEQSLIATMGQFPSVVARACTEYRPQLLCIYLYRISKELAQFYEPCSVLHAESEALKVTRAQLVDAVGRVIQKALALLGIKTLDRM